MKKLYIIVMSAFMLGLIVLNSCASGVPKEDFTKVQNDLADAQRRIAALERRVVAFSAYHMWYDQFTGSGNYKFADSETFIAEFGGVVEFIADSGLQAAWKNYLSAEKPLRDYVARLPADQSKWTNEQTSRYNELVASVYNALRPVGQALLSAIWNM